MVFSSLSTTSLYLISCAATRLPSEHIEEIASFNPLHSKGENLVVDPPHFTWEHPPLWESHFGTCQWLLRQPKGSSSFLHQLLERSDRNLRNARLPESNIERGGMGGYIVSLLQLSAGSGAGFPPSTFSQTFVGLYTYMSWRVSPLKRKPRIFINQHGASSFFHAEARRRTVSRRRQSRFRPRIALP